MVLQASGARVALSPRRDIEITEANSPIMPPPGLLPASSTYSETDSDATPGPPAACRRPPPGLAAPCAAPASAPASEAARRRPPAQRPATCAVAFRRFVGGALGVKLPRDVEGEARLEAARREKAAARQQNAPASAEAHSDQLHSLPALVRLYSAETVPDSALRQQYRR